MSADGPSVVSGSREIAARRRGYVFGPSRLGDSSGSLLTFAGSRWKLWSELASAVEISHSDPNELYTAACWGATATVSSSSGEGKKEYVALGCQSGRVQVWDPVSGELSGPTASAFATIARGADCAIAALASSQPSRASVFVGCRGLPEVLEIGISDGAVRTSLKLGKEGVIHLAASCAGAEWLLSADVGAASSLRLWAVSEFSSARGVAASQQRAVARLAAPANTPTSVDVCHTADSDSSSGRAVAICADGTAQVDVFAFTVGSSSSSSSPASPSKPLSAALALSCHEAIQVARFAGVAELTRATADGRITVVGYGPSSVVLWTFRGGDLPAGAKPGSARSLPPVMTVASDELGGRVLCARLGTAVGSADGELASVVAAFGPIARPAFSIARAAAVKGGKATVEAFSVAAREQQAPKATAAANDKQSAARSGKAPTVLGPMQATVTRKRPTEKRRPEADGEAGLQKRPKLPGERFDGKDARITTTAAVGLSLAPMVRQALRSGESGPLGKVVGTGDPRVMESTVADLSGPEAFDLLQECTKKLVASPMIGPVICGWIQAVLIRHCVYVRSQPALRAALEPLHDVLKARGNLHRNLVRLRGRLQLLRDLGKQAIEVTQRERDSVRTPLLEYVEGDELQADDDDDEEPEEEQDSDSGIDPDDIFADDSDDDF